AAEFAARIHADDTIVLFGRSELDRELPYQPFNEALRWYVLAARPEALREQLATYGAELGQFLPALRTKLPELPEPAARDPDSERARLFEGVAQILRGASEQAPVLLVIDQLDQASSQTLALLRHVLDGAGSARLLIVGLVGPAAADSAWAGVAPDLHAAPGTTRDPLEGLTVADLTALVEREGGLEADAAAMLAGRIHAETEGNPRFVGDLVARLREAGSFEPGAVAPSPGSLGVAAESVFEAACPYMGLRAFQPEDAALFFGREDAAAGLLSRLSGARLLSVVGASGSGKSSLVRAGLVPALRQGALPGSRDWPVVLLTPGAHPLTELAAQLAQQTATSAASLLADLESDPRSLDLAVRQVLVDATAGARLLLVVDQFEELFSLTRDETERRRFIDALLHAVTVPGGRTVAILALRADFYGEAAGYPGFAEALEASNTLLGPMGEDDLRATIERPAQVAGLRLEPGLSDLILNDVGTEPGGLPLLSHALLETWKRRDGRTLTIAAYRAAGGVRGAIAQTADAVYATLPEGDQATARNLFVRLTELGEGTEDTRRRVAFAEVVPDSEEGTAVREVIGTLADARLLTTGEDSVEVAHEALIREWPRLRRWLDEDRDGLRLMRHLTESAQGWEAADRDTDELYRGARLSAAGDWAATSAPALNPLERAFLEASNALQIAEEQAAARRLRRLRVLLAGVAALFGVAVVVGIVAGVQWGRANDEASRAEASLVVAEEQRSVAEDRTREAEAERGRADQEAVAARRSEADAVTARETAVAERDRADAAALIASVSRLAAAVPLALESDRTLAMLLAVEARRRLDTPATRGLLQSVLLDDKRLLGYLHGTPGLTFGLTLSPAGDLAAYESADGLIQIWDLTTRERIGEIQTDGCRPYLTQCVQFSPDGSRLVSSGPTIQMFRVDTLAEE
ncbi:MAG: AAA family ATPase, partial [Proteobacteria bacterium]|nr:AAA family ATPase [Pseudomonadota bacterium]